MRDTDLIRFQAMNTGIIDSHAHLVKEFFLEDQKLIIENLKAANITHVINPGIDLKTMPELIDLAENNANLYLGIGLHPHQANEWTAASEEIFEQYIKHPKVVAVGECGLDFYYNNSAKEEQIHAFTEQVRIARKFDKPLIVHCRDAWDELFAILAQSKDPIRGVLHCFTGNADVVQRLQQLGSHVDFYISFSGIVTFPKAEEIQEAAKIVASEKLLVETDCPFLAPLPVRGKRNEPAYVWYTAEKLSELRKEPLTTIASLCSANAKRLFALPAHINC